MAEKPATVAVQMRLRDTTLERVEHIKQTTGIQNRTQIVSSAIHITDEIIRAVAGGAKVYIEKKDGTRERLVITGL